MSEAKYLHVFVLSRLIQISFDECLIDSESLVRLLNLTFIQKRKFPRKTRLIWKCLTKCLRIGANEALQILSSVSSSTWLHWLHHSKPEFFRSFSRLLFIEENKKFCEKLNSWSFFECGKVFYVDFWRFVRGERKTFMTFLSITP